MMSFHHDATNGEPRLLAPSFQAAAKWLHRTAVARPKASGPDDVNPATTLAAGRSAMAILSLAELGQLPRKDGALPSEIDLAPVPGTKVWYDAAGMSHPPADKVAGINYVPYFGSAGWLAVVRKSAANPDIDFELAAELSGLERSTELLSDPALGFGPTRIEHLDPSRDAIWQRYGFDVDRSRKLALAVRHQIGAGLAFPAVGLRGSDREVLLGHLAKELARTIAGEREPQEALRAADAAWRASDARRPQETWKLERRNAAGLR
jgi:multiple sugar transport system substrate-binding protein